MIIKKNKLVFMGAPGTGKGTISQMLKNQYNFVHLSTGDLFRELIKSQTPLGETLNNLIQEGKYISDDITNQVIKQSLQKITNNQIIFDGYPRTINQAKYLDNLIKIDLVILLEPTNLNVIIDRISNRLICPKCQRVYNSKEQTRPKIDNICDDDNVKLISRNDDQKDIARKRIDVYYNSINEVIEYYQSKKILCKINANLSISDLFTEILKRLME